MANGNQPPPEQPAPRGIHTGGDYVARDKIVLGDEVRGDKFEIHLPRTAPSALHSLPAAPADFTGRTDQIAELERTLAETRIAGVTGMGGVGKTALALVVTNKVKDQYPDAQIYLDLKGTSGEPLTSAEVMKDVIHAFRLDEDLRNYSPDQTAALYRTLLHDKRALLFFDNALDAGQVKPLLPPASCAVVITSRNIFHLPGLHPINLHVLPPQEARDFLLKLCQRVGDSADSLAKACAYLPFALRVAGSSLEENPMFAVHDYLADLNNRRTRLETLNSDMNDADHNLEAVLGYSYDQLAPEQQTLWRALSIFPAPFDESAAADVWEIDESSARNLLADFTRKSILAYDETGKHYSLHDLLRDFAEKRLPGNERSVLSLHHAMHYVEVARDVGKRLKQGGDSIIEGLRLFDSEWMQIRAGQAWSAANAETSEDAASLAHSYPDLVHDILPLRLHPREQVRWLEIAFLAARKIGDKRAEGYHLGNLGSVYLNLGEIRRSIKYSARALEIALEIGDPGNEAIWLANLGNAYDALGETHKAIEYYEKALAVARENGDEKSEGVDLGSLGRVYDELGDPSKAIEYYEQALAIAREIGDRQEESVHLDNFGIVFRELGETHKAKEYHEQALAIAREISDRQGEGYCLDNLGDAFKELGEVHKAIAYYEDALAIAREIGNRWEEGSRLVNLGNAYAGLGQDEKAREYYSQALAILRELEAKREEQQVLDNLAALDSDIK